MLHIDDLARMFQSLAIETDQQPSMKCEDEEEPNMDYENGYEDGYTAGYAEAAEYYQKQSVKPIPTMNRRGRPQFGWKIVNHQLVPNYEEQYVIEAIKWLLKEQPDISLNNICHHLSSRGFTIRKSSRIYPTTIKNIIMTNNLRNNF